MTLGNSHGRTGWRHVLTILALSILVAFGYFAVRLAQEQFPAVAAGLPDLLGAAPRPLPPGVLHVQDLAADLRSYQGEIAVRGIVARYAPNDPQLFALVDTREARLCKSTNCAKFYLPVKWSGIGARPKQWDEIDLRGSLVHGSQYTYLEAARLENLGAIQ